MPSGAASGGGASAGRGNGNAPDGVPDREPVAFLALPSAPLSAPPSVAPGSPSASAAEWAQTRRGPPPECWKASPLVAPPWGGVRANSDHVTHDRVLERQRQYQKLLDDQAASQAALKERRRKEEAVLDASTSRSLATRTHQWGAEMSDPQLERAVYQELVATVAQKQRKEREKKVAELQDFAQWREVTDMQMAAQWQMERERQRQERMTLASAWRTAADESKARKDQERAVTVQSEREAIARLVDGMAAPRRMRRAVKPTECGKISEVKLRGLEGR